MGMLPAEPLALHHSWPLVETTTRLTDGRLLDGRDLPSGDAGDWSCDLADGRLVWTPAVFDLFGLPRDALVTRAEALACYEEGGRAAMERLRAHAIRHRRGFTIDVELRPADGARRWMRLIAAPELTDGRATRLAGLKRDVTWLYAA